MTVGTGFDIEAAARRMNAENQKEDERAKLRRLEAREEAARLAGRLRARDPALRRVWGFGSVFEESRPFSMDSDIDLAIEGGDILQLVSETEVSRFKVDIIDITDSTDTFAVLVREHGTLL
jgi:hypothetical protein